MATVHWFPESASTLAPAIDRLFAGLLVLSGVLILVILGLQLTYCVRYRAGSSANRQGGFAHPVRIELTYIFLPTLAMLGIFVWSALIYRDIQRAPLQAHTIYVVGKQWMWKFRHPDGRQEINELHVPAGEPVRLALTSQDAIHSFYVPAFRLKQDLLPDRYTTLWFEATRPGSYDLYCAEYCGANHSRMRGRIHVLRPADYEAWRSRGLEGPGDDPPASTAQAFTEPFRRYGCNACHLLKSRKFAPRLDGLYGQEVRLANGASLIADEEYLRQSILAPQAAIVAGYEESVRMPSYQGQLSEEELAQLIEAIRHIAHGWPGAEER